MKCLVNWMPLRIRVRSRNAQPHLRTRQVEGLSLAPEPPRATGVGPEAPRIDPFFSIFREIGRLTRPI